MSENAEIETKEKTAILIDGNNFYQGLVKTFSNSSGKITKDLELFDYERFADFFSDGKNIVVRRFYKGVVKKEKGNAKSQRMVSAQQKLFSKLENKGWQVKRGKMSKNSKSGKVEGFYFSDQRIRGERDLKAISEKILSESNFIYSPIIIVDKLNEHWKNLLKRIANNELFKLIQNKGIYYTFNFWKEKGVDVNIAIDMLEMAYTKQVNRIILVSSDSDLKPVVEKTSKLGVKIEYVGFEKMFSIALFNNQLIDNRTILNQEQLSEFFEDTLFNKQEKELG